VSRRSCASALVLVSALVALSTLAIAPAHIRAQAPAAEEPRTDASAVAPRAHADTADDTRDADAADDAVRGVTRRDAPPSAPALSWLDVLDLRLSGYLQLQYEHHDLSRDELQQGGRPLNEDRFLLRRGRLRVDRRWRYAALALEIDASTTRGPFLSVRRAEVTARWPGETDDAPPRAALTLGVSEIPFGHELPYGNNQRIFAERTTASLAFFRGEPDVGARLWGALGPFHYAVAVMNGEPIDDRPGAPGVDRTKAKDVAGRVGVEGTIAERVTLRGGVSFLAGTGLHAGEQASKNHVIWSDLNENGALDTGELLPVPGRAATPSLTFPRWALNADLQVSVRSPFGWSRLSAELTLAQNLDRALFVADPVAQGSDVRELGWYVAFVQDVTPYGVVGFRADYYDPNSDALDARRGDVVPRDASILTISPLVGAVLPGHGRLIVQYDHILDSLGRDATGVPTDLRNDVLTARVQGEF
jgi:hypothetical protein